MEPYSILLQGISIFSSSNFQILQRIQAILRVYPLLFNFQISLQTQAILRLFPFSQFPIIVTNPGYPQGPCWARRKRQAPQQLPIDRYYNFLMQISILQTYSIILKIDVWYYKHLANHEHINILQTGSLQLPIKNTEPWRSWW